MPDIIIKPEDIENMPEKTRELFLCFIAEKLGFENDALGRWVSHSPVNTDPESTIRDDPPEIIPIEAAIAILAPLKNTQGIKTLKLLLKCTVEHPAIAKDEMYEKKQGYTRSQLANKLGISENSVNGVIGGLNRRYAFRFNKNSIDRTKCKFIIFDRHVGIYRFANRFTQISFGHAVGILEEVAKQNVPYEQYNYEGFSFDTPHASLENEIHKVKLNPAAIIEFMGENAESHELSEHVEYFDLSHWVTYLVMSCKEQSIFEAYTAFEIPTPEWFSTHLDPNGRLVGGLELGI